jgi:serine/threonine protein kinase
MEYLFSKKIMHGDLTASNILISNLDRENYLPKIANFGLSKQLHENDPYEKQKRKNIPWKWIDINYFETGIFTMSSDVWSFGVVFWEMLSVGQMPYPGANASETITEKNLLDFDFFPSPDYSWPRDRSSFWFGFFFVHLVTRMFSFDILRDDISIDVNGFFFFFNFSFA